MIFRRLSLLAIALCADQAVAGGCPASDGDHSVWSAIIANDPERVMAFCESVRERTSTTACVSEESYLKCSIGAFALAIDVDGYQMSLLQLSIEFQSQRRWSDELNTIMAAAFLRRAATVKPCAAHTHLIALLERESKIDDTLRKRLLLEAMNAGDPTAILIGVVREVKTFGDVDPDHIAIVEVVFDSLKDDYGDKIFAKELSRFKLFMENAGTHSSQSQHLRTQPWASSVLRSCPVRWSAVWKEIEQ